MLNTNTTFDFFVETIVVKILLRIQIFINPLIVCPIGCSIYHHAALLIILGLIWLVNFNIATKYWVVVVIGVPGV